MSTCPNPLQVGERVGANRYSADFAGRFCVGLRAAKRCCASAIAFASSSTIARIARRSSAAPARRATRSAKETFLFINVSFELAGNSTCLAQARAWLPAQRPVKRAGKGLPLDGELRLLPVKKGER